MVCFLCVCVCVTSYPYSADDKMQEPAEHSIDDMCRICMGLQKNKHDFFDSTMLDCMMNQLYEDPMLEYAQFGELKLCEAFEMITALEVSGRGSNRICGYF